MVLLFAFLSFPQRAWITLLTRKEWKKCLSRGEEKAMTQTLLLGVAR